MKKRLSNISHGTRHSGELTPGFREISLAKYELKHTTCRVSYDDKDTLKLKKQYAADKCLGGTLEWAVDMGDPKSKG